MRPAKHAFLSVVGVSTAAFIVSACGSSSQSGVASGGSGPAGGGHGLSAGTSSGGDMAAGAGGTTQNASSGASAGGSIQAGGSSGSSTGGSAQAGGSGGSSAGGSTASNCPQSPPSNGATCLSQFSCTYLDCSGAGRVTATCDGSVFAVSSVACDTPPIRCGVTDCAVGQICLEQYSGTASRTCVNNSCGTEALSCDCAASLCPKGWTCTTTGVTVQCASPCTSCA